MSNNQQPTTSQPNINATFNPNAAMFGGANKTGFGTGAGNMKTFTSFGGDNKNTTGGGLFNS